MKDPVFLDLEEILDFHALQVEKFGGSAGIRDLGLLQSALAMPRASFGGVFAHADVFEMAAAYLFHLAKNHPFVDGNKRTASMAAHVFLELNGFDLGAPATKYEDLVLRVADGRSSKGDAAAFFRSHSRPAGGSGTQPRRR